MHKAPSPDEIHSRFLKENAVSIAPVLTTLFQRSLYLWVIPKEWKRANVAPVFKKRNRNDLSNYRWFISLICTTRKILEHIICSKIADHLETFNILCEAQHGFRNHRSYASQLPLCIDDIASSLDIGEKVDIILQDFQKAFDKVPEKSSFTSWKNMELRVNWEIGL